MRRIVDLDGSVPAMGASDPHRREQPAPEAILAATERLLGERRFSELAVSDIITAAGVSRTSFYAHFGSRAAVLSACLRRVVGEITVAVDPFVSGADGDPAAAIRMSSRASTDRCCAR